MKKIKTFAAIVSALVIGFCFGFGGISANADSTSASSSDSSSTTSSSSVVENKDNIPAEVFLSGSKLTDSGAKIDQSKLTKAYGFRPVAVDDDLSGRYLFYNITQIVISSDYKLGILITCTGGSFSFSVENGIYSKLTNSAPSSGSAYNGFKLLDSTFGTVSTIKKGESITPVGGISNAENLEGDSGFYIYDPESITPSDSSSDSSSANSSNSSSDSSVKEVKKDDTSNSANKISMLIGGCAIVCMICGVVFIFKRK